MDFMVESNISHAKPHQKKCIEDSLEKLKTNYSIFNTGATGVGKGCVAGIIASQLGLNLFVVAPKNMRPDWEKIANVCGIGKLTFISYDSLAGKGLTCKHPYLKKILDDYEATEELINIIKENTLFVFDESDEAKNPDSQRLAACHAVVKSIVCDMHKCNVKSRILLLSATMIEKKKYSESVFKLLGIVTKKDIVKYNSSAHNYVVSGYGYEEIYKYCYKLNPELTKQLHPVNINSKNINDTIYDMLCKIVKPKLGVSIPRPPIEAQFYPSIDYYTVSDDSLTKLKSTVDLLKKCVFPSTNKDQSITSSQKIKPHHATIMSYLHLIENYMLDLLVKIIYEKLTKYTNRKLIVYVWFDTSADYLLTVFKQFNPLRCDGKVDTDIRQKNIELFQEPNMNYRLIIAKPLAFSKGISLDDKHGGFIRETICVPNYHFNLIHQAAGRTYRTSTKSDAYFSLVFIKDADILDILTILSEKGDVSHDIMVENLGEENITVYPKDYPKVYH